MYKKICAVCGREFETVYHNQIMCKVPHDKTCSCCGKTFQVYGGNFDQDWCSDECRLKLHGKKCEICGDLFVPKNNVQRICSRDHYKTCVVCGKKFKINTGNMNKDTCGRACSCALRKANGDYKERSAKAQSTLRNKCTRGPSNVSKSPKTCPMCGEEFIPESNRQKYCKRQHYGNCPICGKPVPVKPGCKPHTCSEECRVELIRRTTQDRYGVGNYSQTPEFQEKSKTTMLKKYGVEHALQREESKEKFKHTCRERYGTDNPQQCESIRRKTEETNLRKYGAKNVPESKGFKEKVQKTSRERYGIDWAASSTEAKKKRELTNIERYGVDNPLKNEEVKDKLKKTNLLRYGCISSAQSEEVKNRAKETSRERYGTDYPMQSSVIKKKAKEATLEKHGVENVMYDEDIRKKARENSLKSVRARYGVNSVFSIQDIREKIYETNVERYGTPYGCLTNQCMYASGSISSINKKFLGLLYINDIDAHLEEKVDKTSFDICVGRTLIEINPSVTHNSHSNPFNDACVKDRCYHLHRTELAEKNGYRCVHVWDWDDWNKITDLVKPKTRIYARNCVLSALDKSTADNFLNLYHLQNTCRGQKHCYGLYYEGVLVGLMTFGNPRFNKNYQWELLRLCFHPEYEIVGGSERMFNMFLREEDPESIISYCDRSKFTGDVYYRLGMKLKSRGFPSRHWYSYKKEKMPHITDNLLRQRGYDQLFDEHYGKGTSNEELILARGYLPVYDCGQMTFVWNKVQ